MLKNQRQAERTALLRGLDGVLRAGLDCEKSAQRIAQYVSRAVWITFKIHMDHGYVTFRNRTFFNYSAQLMSQAALSYRRLRIIDRENFGELQAEAKTDEDWHSCR
jgi:hypothetical protein